MRRRRFGLVVPLVAVPTGRGGGGMVRVWPRRPWRSRAGAPAPTRGPRNV
ncbi:hypothetical protein SFR_4009 [Streptomyces sp. FR-008]|nr:hypothetical protein SFR_4009 [Streptomyces sp. FR-008]